MAFKSFYDLTNDTAISAKELFKYRLKRDNTVPSKGGQKDFEPDPDGSWMQSKQLEAFLQEWTSVINEPRVEKLKNLVHGFWDENSKLVNVDKPGKFWAHMGFTDNRRNWLYPEEALFLLEINALEVHHKGVSMSIQEAYDTFLGTQVTLPQYQVFAHLRRLGYVVLRHETLNVITDYEMKMNLNKYIDKKSYKARKKEAKALADKVISEDQAINIDDDSVQSEKHNATESMNDMKSKEKALNSSDIQNTSSESSGSNNLEVESEAEKVEDSSSMSLKRSRDDKLDNHSDSNAKRHCSENSPGALDTSKSSEPSSPSRMYYTDIWSECFKNKSFTSTQQTSWQDISLFPDISGNEVLQMSRPDKKLLPENIVLSEEEDLLCFDVQCYRQKIPERSLTQKQQREDEDEQRVEGLNFSFAEWTCRKPVIKSSNWVEHKKKTVEYWEEMATATPVSHLWEGDVTPLIHPLDASTTGCILQKLDIIKSADTNALKVSKDISKTTPLSFDVHLPDKSFKKSMPGKPDHRVLVTKSAGQPPELCHLMALSQPDSVPVHWAVVDSGEIAFYVFDTSFKLETLT